MLVWKELSADFVTQARFPWVPRLFYGGQGKLSPRTSR